MVLARIRAAKGPSLRHRHEFGGSSDLLKSHAKSASLSTTDKPLATAFAGFANHDEMKLGKGNAKRAGSIKREMKTEAKGSTCRTAPNEASTNQVEIYKRTPMKLTLKPLSAAVLMVAALHFCAACARAADGPVGTKPDAARTQQASPVAATGNATSLADGAEIFENLTESSPKIDAVGFKKSLSEFETLHPEISRHLSPERKMRLDSLVAGVRNAWGKGNRSALAIQSIEAYRLLQESIDHSGKRVPLEVSLLDYAGFKLNGLLIATRPDWKQVAKTVREAAMWWSAIEPRITDETLRGAMGHTIKGIKDAAARKDAKLLRFAADMDLILVDGLETFFNSHPPTR